MEGTNFQFVMIAMREMRAEIRGLQRSFTESIRQMQVAFEESVQQMQTAFVESTDRMFLAMDKIIQGMELLGSEQSTQAETIRAQAARIDELERKLASFEDRLNRIEKRPPAA